MNVEMTVYYLEMKDKIEYSPSAQIDPDFWSKKIDVECPEINKMFYIAVGSHWDWIDKLEWTNEQWHQYGTRKGLETWIGYYKNTPAGYFELEFQNGGDVEIVYFGLLKQFIGKGLGGIFLSQAIQGAWNAGAKRVWLHTCNLDHPAALENYIARGFKLFKTEKEYKEINR